MTKKKHHEQPHFKLSRHMESKIEKQARTQRIIVIASAVFLGILGLAIAIGLYVDRVMPRNEPMLQVNYRTFTTGYYADLLEVYSQGMEPTQVPAIADAAVSQMVRDEIIRQAAPGEGIIITADEVEAELKRVGRSNTAVMRDLAESALATTALTEKFKENVPETMEQIRFEIMLVESRSKATEVETAVAAGTPLTDLTAEYSAAPEIQVTQDWVPYEVLANKDVAAQLQAIEPGSTAVVHDPTAVKNLGYWLIEIVDKDDEGNIKPRAMLCGNLEDALRAKARLATEDFAVVAKQYSQLNAMTEDAEFDWITPEDVVTEAFNAAAFSLELNVVSEPILEREIQTNGAYWVVRLLERDTRAPYDAVKDALASTAFDAWYAEVSQAAVVNRLLTDEQKAWALEQATS